MPIHENETINGWDNTVVRTPSNAQEQTSRALALAATPYQQARVDILAPRIPNDYNNHAPVSGWGKPEA